MEPRPRIPIVDCHHCVVRALSPFCGDLNAQEMTALMNIKSGYIYEKDQAIFYEGNPCEGIYVLCSGSVKLTQSSETGRQQILGIVAPGDLVEKSALFHPGRHSATAEALERAEVSFFRREAFFDLLKGNGRIAVNVISVLSREIESGRERTRGLLFKSARERLAETLLDLGRRFGRPADGGAAIELRLKREELAEMVGVTLETAVRLLSAFNKEKLIRLVNKTIVILDEEGLRKVKE